VLPSVTRSVERFVTQSVAPSVERFVTQSVTQSVERSVTQSVTRWVERSVERSVTRFVDPPVEVRRDLQRLPLLNKSLFPFSTVNRINKIIQSLNLLA
jgi:hypothetical protein